MSTPNANPASESGADGVTASSEGAVTPAPGRQSGQAQPPGGRSAPDGNEAIWGGLIAVAFSWAATGFYVWPELAFRYLGHRTAVIRLPDEKNLPEGSNPLDALRYGFRHVDGRTIPLAREQVVTGRGKGPWGMPVEYRVQEIEYVVRAPEVWRAVPAAPLDPKKDLSAEFEIVYSVCLVLNGLCAAFLVGFGILAFMRRRARRRTLAASSSQPPPSSAVTMRSTKTHPG